MNHWSIVSLSRAAIAIMLIMAGALGAIAWRHSGAPAATGYGLAAALALLAGLILLRIVTLGAAHRRAHRRLMQSETRYRQIVETAHEGIWLADAEGRISFANQRSADLVGYSVEELLGRRLTDFIAADPARVHCPIYQQPERDIRQLSDLRYRRRDGGLGWAIVGSHTLRDGRGRFAGALVMVTDITARKHGEQALREAHDQLEHHVRARTTELETAVARLRAEIAVREAAELARAQSEDKLHEIITMMPLALCIKDPGSRIVLMNDACETMFGQPFSVLSGTRGSAHYPPEQMAVFLAQDRAAFASGRLEVNEEWVWNAALGENRRVQTYKKPIFDARGEAQMLIAMCVDITERMRTEQALASSLSQLRALSEHQHTIREDERRRIALDIHDELGQNLLAMKLDVSALHQRTAGVSPQLHGRAEQVLATLDASIRSVRTIINELHPSTLELGLSAAVDWLLKQLERRGGPRCVLHLLDDSAGALLDQRQTSDIFRIVQSALAHIGDHGQAGTVDVSLNLTLERLTIVISDDGPGLARPDPASAAAFGMDAITERVASMGGELVVARRQGGGGALSILLPGLARTPERATAGALH